MSLHQFDDVLSSMQYEVFCHICGYGWREQDPGVRFIHTDHVWECYDEGLCFERRAGGVL